MYSSAGFAPNSVSSSAISALISFHGRFDTFVYTSFPARETIFLLLASPPVTSTSTDAKNMPPVSKIIGLATS